DFGVCSILTGDEFAVRQAIAKSDGDALARTGTIRVKHAPQVVAMHDDPARVMRHKRQSSMAVACELVREGLAAAALSAGNSGAMMALAMATLGKAPSVLRPCIATLIPSARGRTLLLDAGANVECTARHLAQFAVMGRVYMQCVQGIAQPRVGILANGEETCKGTPVTRQALALLRGADLGAVGHCEGYDLFTGAVDVVVCDGLLGNVALKSAEGCIRFLLRLLRDGIRGGGLQGKLGAWLLGKTLREIKRNIDPAEFGAAPLLGLQGAVYIAHGNADARCVSNALRRLAKSDRPLHPALSQALINYGL
ncbi:MAG: phosphate acyltransferase PlsX, partial [Myxococcota bacterium]